jgi:hypothetical protein
VDCGEDGWGDEEMLNLFHIFFKLFRWGKYPPAFSLAFSESSGHPLKATLLPRGNIMDSDIVAWRRPLSGLFCQNLLSPLPKGERIRYHLIKTWKMLRV